MRMRAVSTLLVCLSLPALACAQSAQLNLPSFDHLKAKATDTVDITIGSWPLGIAAAMMDESDAESAEIKEMLSGLKAIYVRSYEFASDFVYSKADVDSVRRQLSAPDWTQLIQVRDRKMESDVDVYVSIVDNEARGLAIVTSEPRQFTILNIVGSMDLDKLAQLEDHLGLPGLDATLARTAD